MPDVIPSLRSQLIVNLHNPAKQKKYRSAGRASVGNSGHNACAATASQPLIELGILNHIELLAEGLSNACKRTKKFIGSPKRTDVEAGDLIVCMDLNGNLLSDHVFWVLSELGNGWYEILDNQGDRLTHRRRLDGQDGKTPMRGRLRLTA